MRHSISPLISIGTVWSLLILPSGVLAQSSVTIAFTGGTSTTNLVIGKNACDTSIAATYTYSARACKDLTVWVTTASSCGSAPATGDYSQTITGTANTTANPSSNTLNFAVDSLPIFTATQDGGAAVSCINSSLNVTLQVCASLTIFDNVGNCSTNAITGTSPAPTIQFDDQPPATPAINTITSLDSALAVDVTYASNVQQINLVVVQVSTGQPAQGANCSVTVGSVEGTCKLQNLQNGVQYRVTATAVDPAGNQSALSSAALGTPQATLGFFAGYKADGGSETGGCAATGLKSFPFALLLISGTVWLFRRKRGSA